MPRGTPRKRTPAYLSTSPFSDTLAPPASPYCSGPRSPTRRSPRPGAWSPIAVRSSPSSDRVGAISSLRAGDISSPVPSSTASASLTRGSATVNHVRRLGSSKRSSGTLLSAVGFDSDEDAAPLFPSPRSTADSAAVPLQQRYQLTPRELTASPYQAFGYSASLQTCSSSTSFTEACSQLLRCELNFNAADTVPQPHYSDDPCKGMPVIASVVLAPERPSGGPHDARPYVDPSGFGAEPAGLVMVITPSSSPRQNRGMFAANSVPAVASADVAVGASASACSVAATQSCPLAEAAQASSMGSTTPRAQEKGDLGWGSDTPSTDTATQLPHEEESGAADADAEWSFDNPTRQVNGSGKTTQLNRASSPLMTAMWPRGDWKKATGSPAHGVGEAGGYCRKDASPITPSVGPHPGGAASCYCFTLALSPDFSPTLPLPSTTLLARDNPCGNCSNAAVVSNPQCALLHSARKEEDVAEESGDGARECATSGLTASAAPKRSLVEKTPRKEDLRTPRSGRSTSIKSLPVGVPTAPATGGSRSVSCGSVSRTQKLSSAVRQPGVAETAFGPNPTTATPHSAACSTGKCGDRSTSSLLSRSRGSSMSSSSDAVATGSGKKPRYLHSTVSWNLKHG
ncbi:hypothetical protein Vretimale_1926 [Volvox reticuliferus]|nr:hypothetical protein Vretifemale_17302 [Volvox reticuliferus]GIL96019.1 hypothetical protein Vretimale_1926 [Volvox reticuliferus]